MKPNWKPIKVRLGQIKAWDKNPRMSNKAQAQRIIASERKFGQPVPFLISPDFLLYDGHQRLSAWFTVYGADYEMDAMQSDRPLSEDEHKELVITLHTGATGSWNWEALSGWSAGDLQEWGMNADALKGWNNDANNLKELLAAEVEPVDAEPQIDRAAELQEKWQTASGQLWKLGDHRLLIGDCTVWENVERLMGGERADCLISDPPYGIGADKKNAHSSIRDNPAWANENWDLLPTKDTISFILSLSDNCALWGGNYFSNYLPNSSAWLAWIKPQAESGFSLADFELCWTNKEFAARCKTMNRRDGSLHPTQKPVDVMEWTIEIMKSGLIILDPFAGSGTTIIAAHNLNRRCFAMEISEKYGAVILERFFTATGITPELIG